MSRRVFIIAVVLALAGCDRYMLMERRDCGITHEMKSLSPERYGYKLRETRCYKYEWVKCEFPHCDEVK
jgi:hypothetical protein